jgi:hypothetical protein
VKNGTLALIAEIDGQFPSEKLAVRIRRTKSKTSSESWEGDSLKFLAPWRRA